MAATVAHEIKNPLSAIKSIAQVMREDEVCAMSMNAISV
jgi:nitrogen-specific signal transduction histidine kinase